MKAIVHATLYLFFIFSSYTAVAQSYQGVPRSQRINVKCGGFYEFLPASYSDPANAAAKYPLLIDITGTGGEGDGSLQSLEKLLNYDATYFISNGAFPDTFYANNNAYSFIVISPQFSSRGNGADVEAVIDHVMARYRIDDTRIYLAGYSNGGEPAWSYPAMGTESATRIAALVPVAAVNTNSNHTGANFFVESKLPVWALHSTEDSGDETSVDNSIDFVNAINGLNPHIPAELTLLTGTHRETMTNVFDPAKKYTVGNKMLNIYEWMLQYHRISSALPVSLVSFKAAVLDSRLVQLEWVTAAEHNNSFFTIEKSRDATSFTTLTSVSSQGNSTTEVSYTWQDTQPFEGVNYYRLSQTDTDGTTVFFHIVSVTVDDNGTIIRAYPTIVNTEAVKIEVSETINESIDIRIVDTNGRLLYKNSGRNQGTYHIPSSLLSKGLNVINIQANNINRKIKVLKGN